MSFRGGAGDACPFAVDALDPGKGIHVVIKKNPGNSAERYALSGAVVTRCDGSGATAVVQRSVIRIWRSTKKGCQPKTASKGSGARVAPTSR